MSVGTLPEIKHRECRVAGLGWHAAIRADSRSRAGLDVHNGKIAIIDRLELGYSSPGLCLA